MSAVRMMRQTIEARIRAHGSLRAAARAMDIDPVLPVSPVDRREEESESRNIDETWPAARRNLSEVEMTPTDIQRLRALAEKAPPGPWRLVHNSWDISTVYDTMSNPVAQCPIDPDVDEETQEPKEAQKQDTAEYLAALNPATVIALCDLAEKAI